MSKLRKGGPKRKDGVRDGSGRLLPVDDRGTPELQALKLAATGSRREELSALGVLRGRGIIDEDMYEAALDFDRCYRVYIGRPDPRASSLERRERGTRRDWDDDYAARMKTRYWNCLAALREVGPAIFALVRDVCVYERSGGLMGQIIAYDIVRVDGLLISRRATSVPPAIRQRIAGLVRGLEVLDHVPRADFTREASELLARLAQGGRIESGAAEE